MQLQILCVYKQLEAAISYCKLYKRMLRGSCQRPQAVALQAGYCDAGVGSHCIHNFIICRRDTSEESGGEASGSSPTAGARPKSLRKTASKNRHRRPPLRAPAFEVWL